MKIYTSGSFDVITPGHIELFTELGRFGEVYVALNPDWYINQYKGHSPTMPYKDREAILKGIKGVTEVFEKNEAPDIKPSVLRVKPNLIVYGWDWANESVFKNLCITREWLNEQKISLMFIPRLPNISSTNLKNKIYEEGKEKTGTK